MSWSSLKLVRKATLPSLVEANQVPPHSSSLPPKIVSPSHHANGDVGLCHIQHQRQESNSINKPSI